MLTETSQYGEDMVEIYVGLERKRFVLHKKVLCLSYTNYWNTMFNGGFGETGKQHCDEPDMDSKGFAFFIQCLYAGEFPRDIRHAHGSADACEYIIKFYILADKYCMHESNLTAAIHALLNSHSIVVAKQLCRDNHTDKYPAMSSKAANVALDYLPEEDPMFRLVTDIVCRDFATGAVNKSWLGEAIEGIPESKVLELISVMALNHNKNNTWSDSSEIGKALKVAYREGISGFSRYKRGSTKTEGDKGVTEGATPKMV